MQTSREVYEIGALLRPAFRRMLVRIGARWTEGRGLLDSTFSVVTTDARHAVLRGWCRDVQAA